MTLTRATIITWATRADQHGSNDLNIERQALLDGMVGIGKTDGVPIMISETATQRNWIDQAAAEEYVRGISQLAIKYNR